MPIEVGQGFILFGRFIVVVEGPSAPAMNEMAIVRQLSAELLTALRAPVREITIARQFKADMAQGHGTNSFTVGIWFVHEFGPPAPSAC